jgi:hypothetical protein
MLTRLLISIAASVCLLACAASTGSGGASSLSDADRARIKEFASAPLAEFLNRFYLKSVGPVDAVNVTASFNYSNNHALYRPRAILGAYCEANGGTLLRQSKRQVNWSDVSPEAFADPRTSGTAKTTLRNMCDPNDMNPGCGASNASREGVFGTFQCRTKGEDRLLWSVSIEGAQGRIVSQTTQTAEMRIRVAPLP